MRYPTKTKINQLLIKLILFSIIGVLSSCSIEKRLHTKGWNIQWHKQSSTHSSKTPFVQYDETDITKSVNESTAQTQQTGLISESAQNELHRSESSLVEIQKTDSEKLIFEHVNSNFFQSTKIKFTSGSSLKLEENTVDNRWIGFFVTAIVSILVGGLIILFLDPAALLLIQLITLIAGGLLILIGAILLVTSLVLLVLRSQNKTPVSEKETPIHDTDSSPKTSHQKINPEPRDEPDRPQKKNRNSLILIGFLATAIVVFLLVKD